MLWSPTACVLLLALVACRGEQGDAISRVLQSRDYGVKLCGREFIRAVIFTCGGSRWKRLNMADDAFQRSPDRDEQPAIHNLLHRRRSSAFSSDSGTEVLTVHTHQSKRNEPEWFNVLGALAKLHPRIGDDDSSRGRRHFSQGVAGVCCSQGCTRNDIGRLC
ncbi:relaxin-3-like [Corythoichthys intestinalis]|uniref:relaxin-3-like n=1 Tax=Corythoichthys intestinalis TaxID=161448 RepID=UPI0025A5327C|nr:relaxin-3-like [Corythoichthys intestinalis]XP_061800653.1 relaxin-3-like [Nerophis lumbriciformis]